MALAPLFDQNSTLCLRHQSYPVKTSRVGNRSGVEIIGGHIIVARDDDFRADVRIISVEVVALARGS